MTSRVLKGHYFPHSSTLEVDWNSSGSYLWRVLCWGREVLFNGLRKMIGNSRLTFVFNDPWIPRPSSFQVISYGSRDDRCIVAKYITLSGSWDLQKLNEDLLLVDVEEIIKIPIS